MKKAIIITVTILLGIFGVLTLLFDIPSLFKKKKYYTLPRRNYYEKD